MSEIGFDLHHEDDEPPGNRRRLLLVVGICMGMLLTILGGGVAIGGQRVRDLLGPAADYSGNGSGNVTVTINPGDSAREIGQKLKDAGGGKRGRAVGEPV